MHMSRYFRLLSIALASTLCAACTTSASLRSGENRGRQPVVTESGTVSESRSDQLIANVAGADTAKEKAELKTLTDHVRASLSQPLVAGNRATVLVDGPATFLAIDKAIAQARHHVHVETYIFADDEFGRNFSKQLVEKRKQGVEVRVIYDAVGSIESSQSFFDELKDSGVEVIEFHPINPVKTFLWKMHNRDHRKIIVVDG
jgi:cardiolipin synthase